MQSQIKKLVEQDLSGFWEIVVLSGSEGYNPAYKQNRVEWFKRLMNEVEGFGYYGAFSNNKLVGAMAIVDFKMNCRSSIVGLSGVGMVHTDMLHKKEKVCREMMTYFIDSNRAEGTNLLYLSPFRPDFYKKMGFGYGTSLYHYRIPPLSFPNIGSKEHLMYASDDDKQGFFDCRNRIVLSTHGEASFNSFFLTQGFGSGKKTIIYKDNAIIQGALTFSFGNEKEMVIEDMFYENVEVLRAFCSFLHSQSDQFDRILFSTPDEHFYYILQDPTDGVKKLECCSSTVDNMFRIIDVAGFFGELKETNFNDQNAIVSLYIHDSFCPQNNGITTLEFVEGKVKVLSDKRTDSIEMSLDIADFSSLMMGSINVKTLYRLGLMDISDSKQIDLLEKLFLYGQKPRCTEHV